MRQIRRMLLQALGAVCVIAGHAWPQVANAQAARKVHRIGVLGPDISDAAGPIWDAFVDELAQRGYREGLNVVFERRFGRDDRPDLLAQAAAELVELKVDVIFAARGTASALAARKATAEIPVVFYSSADPVGLGVVDSLARPGGNLTGNAVLSFDLARKGLEMLTEITPQLREFAFFRPLGTATLPWMLRVASGLAEAAIQLRLKAHFVDVESVVDLQSIIERLQRQGVRAALLFDFPLFRPHMDRIAGMFIHNGMSSYGYASAGFLIQYAEPRVQLARSAAAYVDRILRGTRPADLPVEQVSTFDLVINLKTAKALGLHIPQGVLVRATEIIE